MKTLIILLSLCWGFESWAQADSTVARTYAQFPGGKEAMNALMKEQIHYPQEAYDLGIDGKCYLRFVVEADGSVGDVNVLRGVTDCPECDKEAIRFMKNLPIWIPGTVDGKPVVSHFNIYIHFNLY